MEINDMIFKFVYNAALNDATMQQAYSSSKKELIENSENAKVLLRKYIDTILDGGSTINSFNEISGDLIKEFQDFTDFTFGNIQKLINMTAKYFFISTYDETNRTKFLNCHCPMDSIMIKAVVSEYKEAIKSDPIQKSKKLEYFLVEGKQTKDWSKVSWSKIKDIETTDKTSISIYYKYQDMVKYLCDIKKCMPLELDYILFDQEK